MNSKVSLLLCALLVCSLYVSTLWTTARADDPPLATSRDYQIDRQVDAVRYVDTVIARNNRHGDWIVEFTAERTDMPDTREWWSLTIENDPLVGHQSHLHVDDMWILSSSGYEENETLIVTISAPGQTASVEAENLCASPQFGAFQAIIVQTQEYRSVVIAVLQAIEEVRPEIQFGAADCTPDNSEWLSCMEGCGTAPTNCHQEDTCAKELLCCLRDAAVSRCRRNCRCDHLCPTEGVAKCTRKAEEVYEELSDLCFQIFYLCVEHVECS